MGSNDLELIYHAGISGAPIGFKWSNGDSMYIKPDMNTLKQSFKFLRWNPLTSNEEAFKLAIDLDISFMKEHDELGVCVSALIPHKYGHGHKWVKVYYRDCDDEYEATRLVIVKTAAIIGGMENE